jgi:hypothetical protein
MQSRIATSARELEYETLNYSKIINEVDIVFHKDVVGIIDGYLRHREQTLPGNDFSMTTRARKVEVDKNTYMVTGSLDLYYGSVVSPKQTEFLNDLWNTYFTYHLFIEFGDRYNYGIKYDFVIHIFRKIWMESLS